MKYYAVMSDAAAKLTSAFGSLGRPVRELALLALGLLIGLLAMPLLILIAGTASLGPYANGGYSALLGDFLGELAQGSLASWIVLASPYLILSLLRLLRLTLRSIAARG
jgi:hypothetical protein